MGEQMTPYLWLTHIWGPCLCVLPSTSPFSNPPPPSTFFFSISFFNLGCFFLFTYVRTSLVHRSNSPTKSLESVAPGTRHRPDSKLVYSITIHFL
jgi:hypothetical protein